MSGVPRCHVNRHGDPKPALTREDAIGLALSYEYDRQTDPLRRNRGHVDAYECRFCGSWHVGTMRESRRRPVLQVEIGDRAWWNLGAENRGDPTLRIWQLVNRARRRGREAMPSRRAA